MPRAAASWQSRPIVPLTASPISTYFRVSDGVRVRYADTKADSDITVLMLAPWPETLWAFRRIWDRLVVDWITGGYRRFAT
jgi:hypothetical protein